jgi:hypothetical protein
MVQESYLRRHMGNVSLYIEYTTIGMQLKTEILITLICLLSLSIIKLMVDQSKIYQRISGYEM